MVHWLTSGPSLDLYQEVTKPAELSKSSKRAAPPSEPAHHRDLSPEWTLRVVSPQVSTPPVGLMSSMYQSAPQTPSKSSDMMVRVTLAAAVPDMVTLSVCHVPFPGVVVSTVIPGQVMLMVQSAL